VHLTPWKLISLSKRANILARVMRGYFPNLTPSSPREVLIAWLQLNDRDGVWTDAASEAEGWPPTTIEQAWEGIAATLAECE
jgi:DNA-binding transcriptional MocR family regulator